MAFPIIRQLSAGRFAIDNGEQAPLLDICPCCGLSFDSEKAAQGVIDAINYGRLDFGQALTLAKILRKAGQ